VHRWDKVTGEEYNRWSKVTGEVKWRVR
jgi:hypothetical protein